MDTVSRAQLHISVRNLVEWVFRSGDIDNRQARALQADAMLEGSRIHRRIQKSMGDSYQAEVPLLCVVETEKYDLTVEGRADGIFREKITWVDEIKGIYRDLRTLEEPIYVHQAQAMCYAYMLAQQRGLPEIGVQMTYCNLDDQRDRKYFREVFSRTQLTEWFDDLITRYRKWADWSYEWRLVRQASIQSLKFPFSYREGQYRLAGDVYRTILRRKMLFLQAPTGVGKTVSTLFPAVKAVGEGLAERIFYLTAKTVTAQVAQDTFLLFYEQGYRGKVLRITAKEKLCLCDEMECNPVHCPYAAGHYDRVNDAVYDLLQRVDLFTRDDILEQARQYEVCPFEMSLDIASFSDAIICDYNYAFDPNVSLKHFFSDNVKEDYIFLVDEAHNLAERAREMYSAAVVKEDLLAAKRVLKACGRADRRIIQQLDRCNRILLDWKRETTQYQLLTQINTLYYELTRLMALLDEFLQKPADFPERRTVLDLYFCLRDFINTYELADEHYVVYSGFDEGGRFFVKLFCVDPSANLQACMDKARAVVLFSATLLPIHYYKKLLSTRTDNYAIYADTSFKQEQRLLLVGRDVSSRYTRRNEAEFARIAAYIDGTARAHAGNYMAFFPSYQMLGQVYEAFVQLQLDKGGTLCGEADIEKDDTGIEDVPKNMKTSGMIVSEDTDTIEENHVDDSNIGEEVIIQHSNKILNRAYDVPSYEKIQAGFLNEKMAKIEKTNKTEHKSKIKENGQQIHCENYENGISVLRQQPGMTEAQREDFLREFEKEREGSLVAFCVMGGIFGEGIDLAGDRLVGAIVVGTGLPQIGDEREILRDYYDEHGADGFDYAYRFPGFVKVLQAAGRVIRTANDCGVILLLDERFLHSDEYTALFPREWEGYETCTLQTFQAQLEKFWHCQDS